MGLVQAPRVRWLNAPPQGARAVPEVPAESRALLESADRVLLESGDFLLLEA